MRSRLHSPLAGPARSVWSAPRLAGAFASKPRIAAQTQLLALLLAVCPFPASAQLEILPAAAPQQVFALPARRVEIEFRNPTDKMVQLNLSTRLYQASVATLMPVGDIQPWKSLAVLPKQTIIETITLDFPEVRGPSRFQLQWLDERKAVLGHTDMLVYPDNLLKKLSALADDKPIGLLDPERQISPILMRQKVECKILENSLAVEEFQGRLVILGPFSSATQVTRDFPELTKRVTAKARARGAIVWFEPPLGKIEPSKPVHTVRVGAGAVVVAPGSTVADFADSPAAQLNLLHFAELALDPDSSRLPQTHP